MCLRFLLHLGAHTARAAARRFRFLDDAPFEARVRTFAAETCNVRLDAALKVSIGSVTHQSCLVRGPASRALALTGDNTAQQCKALQGALVKCRIMH